MVAGLPCLTSRYGAEYKNACRDSRRPSLTADCVRTPSTGGYDPDDIDVLSTAVDTHLGSATDSSV